MINTLVLHGDLGERFGNRHTLAAASPRELFRALACQHPEFMQAIASDSFRLSKVYNDVPFAVEEDMLDMTMNGAELHVYPRLHGARGKGIGKLIAGLGIVALAVATGGTSLAGTAFLGISFGTVAAFGVMIALGGLSMLLAPSPKGKTATETDKNDSFLFNGAQNVSEQGNVVPLIYGTMRVGSVVASSDISNDNYVAGGTAYTGVPPYSELFPSYPGVGGGAGVLDYSSDSIWLTEVYGIVRSALP